MIDHIFSQMITGVIALVLVSAFIAVFFSGDGNIIINMQHWFNDIINGSRLML